MWNEFGHRPGMNSCLFPTHAVHAHARRLEGLLVPDVLVRGAVPIGVDFELQYLATGVNSSVT